jgi:ribokinase
VITATDVGHVGECIRDAGIVLMQNEISPEAALRAIEVAHAAHIPVMFNYAPVAGAPIPVSSKMNMLIVNETEASQLVGTSVKCLDDARDAAYQLHEMGPAVVVVTLGPEGSYVVHKNEGSHVPAYKVKAVDTTGAGDAFCGALAVALLEEKSLEEAVRFATAASAISVTKTGAQPSIPKREEIDAFMEQMQ